MSFPVANDAVTKAFQNLGNEWALLAAGDAHQSNAMTVSWGSLGFLWQRPVVMVMARPQRYTHDFLERCDHFSVSFYHRDFRKALNRMGTSSGRDGDKAAQAGLTPILLDGVPTFDQAYLTVVARKIYRGQMQAAGFLDPAVDSEWYPEKDYHTLYFGEIVRVEEKA